MTSDKRPTIGVLLVNLGTPAQPTASAVRRYLRAFLGDRRVVDLPRLLWKPLLELVILPLRSGRVAKLYASIWMAEGSPLRHYSLALARRIASLLGDGYRVELAMTYGEPSLPDALARLRAAGVEELVVLPLYPQYSATTTAAVFDQLSLLLRQQRDLPSLHFVRNYHQYPAYIAALAASITRFWRQHGKAQKLMFSFHGIPQRFADAGDPYPRHCQQTAEAVAALLGLQDDEWLLCYQSRFGREPWLQPYTDQTLTALPGQGTTAVQVICPAFAVDCLETLEEIAEQNRELFLHAGGQSYQYIPCLNDDDGHAAALTALIRSAHGHQEKSAC